MAKKKFSEFVGRLRERQAAGDFDTTGCLTNAIDVELASARQQGRHKYCVKLLALKSFLGGEKFPGKGEPGRAHMKGLAVDLLGAGLLAPGRMPHETMTRADYCR